ncbi:MAG: hypothetical protein LUG12_06200 [Erysipelotrichaceae bacterium]|nr:hypothetical protein [Erysipelotrichaceae bacterium]
MKKLSQIFMVVCYIIAGILLGIGMITMIPGDLYWYDDLIAMVFMIVVAYMAIMIQVIIHELGHMMFGLLSGYHFVSFRIFNMMLIKQNNHLTFKIFSLPGTGGQCLMAPPDIKDGHMPITLYNLGGIIMNIIASIIFYLLYTMVDNAFMSLFLYILIVIGIITAITNGIPMQVNNINNDGYNVLELKRNSKATHAFYFQLKIAQLQSAGYRYKDMPIEFKISDESDLDNCLVAMQQAIYCNYLMDKHEFDDALELLNTLVCQKGISGINKYLLDCDRIYIELLHNNKQNAKRLYTKNLQRFMKTMKNYPAVLRTQYCYAIGVENNQDKADKILTKFNNIKHYPYPGEIMSEDELMAIYRKNFLRNNII